MTTNAFLSFVNAATSPFHAVHEACKRLEDAGFERLGDSGKSWQNLKKGGRYYVTASSFGTFMAFVVGQKFDPKSSGFVIAGSHTDSPCLRLRPQHAMQAEKFELVGVQLYGGGIWRSWFDRGLGVAGVVIVKSGDRLEQRLVRIDRPIALIPSLAIHLTTAAEEASFTFSKEDHLRPVLARELKEQTKDLFTELVAKELRLGDGDSIASMDLCFFDATPGRTWGLKDEFVESGRLDNLVSVWAGVEAISSVDVENLEDIAVAVAWDHEECGSLSATGADGKLLERWLEAIASSLGQSLDSLLERSFVLSTDGAHGVHPNYANKHQGQHKPLLNAGVVVKTNSNQRYCTAVPQVAMLREICPPSLLQDFVVRNDSPCGTTIGPLSTALLAVPGVDVGVPMWAMHSARESAGVEDLGHLRDLTKATFEKYRAAWRQFKFL